MFRLVVFCSLALFSYPVLWHNVILQMHCSGLAWHPDVATQMVLASEDDRLPVIQMWDLRFASSPLRVLESHTRYERRQKSFLLWGLLVGRNQASH